jgi:hypothetical protein
MKMICFGRERAATQNRFVLRNFLNFLMRESVIKNGLICNLHTGERMAQNFLEGGKRTTQKLVNNFARNLIERIKNL